MMTNLLFRKEDLHGFLERRKFELKKEVENYDPNYILNVSEEDFCQYLVSKYSLKPPTIYEDKIYVYSQKEVDINISGSRMGSDRPFYVKGVQVIIAVPFEGDGELFQYTPSRFTYDPPHGEIMGQEIHLTCKTAEHNAEGLKQMY